MGHAKGAHGEPGGNSSASPRPGRFQEPAHSRRYDEVLQPPADTGPRKGAGSACWERASGESLNFQPQHGGFGDVEFYPGAHGNHGSEVPTSLNTAMFESGW